MEVARVGFLSCSLSEREHFPPLLQVYLYKRHRRVPAPRRQKLRGPTSPSVFALADGSFYAGGFLGAWETLGTSATPNWSRSCMLGLGLSLGLGLWPAEPETPGNVGMSTFPELWVSNVGKLTEVVTADLLCLGLDLLELDEALDNLGTCTHGLGIVGLHLLQALLLVLLVNTHVPQELGFYPLRDSYLCDWGLLMPFLGHFRDWLCMV